MVLQHSRKLSLTHLEADLLETGPVMELCQTRLLPIVVITAITVDANVNLSFICMEKQQNFDEGQYLFTCHCFRCGLHYPEWRCVCEWKT